MVESGLVAASVATVAACGTSVTGAALAAELDGVDLDSMTFDELLDQTIAWGRLEAWCAGRRLQALARLGSAGSQHALSKSAPELSAPVLPNQDAVVAEEYARAAHISTGQAAFDLHEAQLFTGPLKSVGDGLLGGTISMRHARKISGVLRPMLAAIGEPATEPTTADELAETLGDLATRTIDYARTHTPAETARSATRWLLSAAPEVAELDRRRAMALRDVEHLPADNGMGVICITGPVDQTMRAMLRIDLAAKADATATDDETAPDGRVTARRMTLGQRRADLALTLLCGALVEERPVLSPTSSETSGSSSQRWPRPAVQCNLTMDLTTALGLNDNAATLNEMPISASYARELLADAEFRRLLLHPLTGEVLDRTPTVYRPPVALAEFVRARDPVCIVPGCLRPAAACDLDHRRPFDHSDPGEGGQTVREDLAPLCRSHHVLKTHAGFRLEPRNPRREEAGREVIAGPSEALSGLPPLLDWVTPSGRRYPIEPRDHCAGADPHRRIVEARLRRLSRSRTG